MTRPPAASPLEALAPVTARAGYMMGVHADRAWTPDHAIAWEGMLELNRRLRREAEAILERDHELSVSMLGIMGRLLRAPERTLRQTDLADAMGLSLSRISRIIDILERRELVGRQRCPSDARATNVCLTDAGAARAEAAQGTVFGFVERAFAGRLSEDEIRTLAGIFSRLLVPPEATPPA